MPYCDHVAPLDLPTLGDPTFDPTLVTFLQYPLTYPRPYREHVLVHSGIVSCGLIAFEVLVYVRGYKGDPLVYFVILHIIIYYVDDILLEISLLDVLSDKSLEGVDYDLRQLGANEQPIMVSFESLFVGTRDNFESLLAGDVEGIVDAPRVGDHVCVINLVPAPPSDNL
ncbi:hypothetical protein Hanom_Chr09g00846841 [Helianthus anomalus]